MKKHFSLWFLPVFFLSCDLMREAPRLPILGPFDTEGGDTLYHQIPAFRFVNQDGDTISDRTFRDKIYLADFFFTSCPSICPKMKASLLRVHDRYLDERRLLLLSHSIDTRRDSVPVLKEYAEKLGVSARKWHFVTGSEEAIYSIAGSYLLAAAADAEAPGGYLHSGALVLLDSQRRIRGFYDGTDEKAVDKLIADIPLLLHETQ